MRCQYDRALRECLLDSVERVENGYVGIEVNDLIGASIKQVA